MHELDDHDLLRQYAEQNSETAFAALVARHLDKVYSVALRHTRNAHAAEEITQAVFVILAKKSGRLGGKVILAGWLYETARLTAVTFIRSEIRRARREQEAHMQTALNENADDAWPHIAPLLDDALAGLSAAERHAVVLRYFDGKTLGEVGAALGASEDAAKKRVTRAVEKLRGYFTKRGVTLTATVLTAAISANSVQAAPLGLAKTISVIAIAKGATAGGSTLTLIKGALKVMAWTKMKTAAVVGLVAVLATGTMTIAIHEHTKPEPKFNLKDFRATSYPTMAAAMPQDLVYQVTNGYGHPLNYSFTVSPVRGCSINGLLNQCMEVSGWRYLIDTNVAAGSVQFGCAKAMNGKEWVAAFENTLQTEKPEWWENKHMRRENLVLIRFPEQKTVLVLPKEKATKYQ